MDFRILEPSRLIATARRDVLASLRYEAGEPFYFLEDPVRNRHFRLGLVEYGIFNALDGRRPVADVVVEAAQRDGSRALSTDEAVLLVKWLVETGLAYTDATINPSRLDDDGDAPEGLAEKLANPWFIKLSFGAPRPLLDRLEPVGRVIFSRGFFGLWAVCVLAGLGTAIAEWPQIVAARPIDFGWSGMVRMLFAWCLLKALHETGHALACERFGGHVGGCGVALILGMPSPFVEVSSVWRMPDKWKRIVVSFGGVYVELFVAAAAILLWSQSTSDAVRQCALATATVASIGTVLFNMNPLMRFDGYFVLSDWLEVPNLASRARQELGVVVRRELLGFDEPSCDTSAFNPRWLPWYGAAATIWKCLVVVSLLFLSLSRFGAAFTAAMCVLPLLFIASRLRAFCAGRHRKVAPSRSINLRRLVRNYALLGAGCAAWLMMFDPRRVEMSAVVDYEPLCVVRADTAGFVSRVCVADGDAVVAGQTLFELSNPELDVSLKGAEDEVSQSLVRSRILRDEREVAKEQAEAVHRGALEAKLAELRTRREDLTIRAPIAGRIVSRGTDALVGQWLEPGREVALIGDETKKEAVVAVRQYDAELIRGHQGAAAAASLGMLQKKFNVQVARLEPEATRVLLHPAMSTEHGGDLPVRHVERDDAATPGTESYDVELHEPYFRLHCSLSADDAAQVAAGRTARLYVDATWRQLATRWWLAIEGAVIAQTK